MNERDRLGKPSDNDCANLVSILSCDGDARKSCSLLSSLPRLIMRVRTRTDESSLGIYSSVPPFVCQKHSSLPMSLAYSRVLRRAADEAVCIRMKERNRLGKPSDNGLIPGLEKKSFLLAIDGSNSETRRLGGNCAEVRAERYTNGKSVLRRRLRMRYQPIATHFPLTPKQFIGSVSCHIFGSTRTAVNL